MDIPYVDRIHSLNLMISTWKKFSDNAIPTKAKAGGGYLNTSLAKKEAKRLGFDDALMMDDNGGIVEGSSTNLFIVYKN
jgi:branched-chain amino acid aminotransferase